MSDAPITRGELDEILTEELDPIRERLRSVATHEDLSRLGAELRELREDQQTSSRQQSTELTQLRATLDSHNSTVVGLLRGREKETAIAGEQRRKTLHLLVDRLTAPLADWRVMLGLVVLAAIALAGAYGLTVVTDYGSVGPGAASVAEPTSDGDADKDVLDAEPLP